MTRSALALTALLSSASASAQAPTEHSKNFDLTCAVVSAAEIATTAPDTEPRNTAYQLQFFYLGRLSGRDDKTLWTAVIKGRVAELREKAKSPESEASVIPISINDVSF